MQDKVKMAAVLADLTDPHTSVQFHRKLKPYQFLANRATLRL